jgi:uncharacterized protein (TIGR02246 family)
MDGNGDDFAAPYTDDSDFIGFDGTYMKGHEEIASFHQMLFDKLLRGSRLIGKIRSMRFVTVDIAIMIAVGGTNSRTVRYRTRAKFYSHYCCCKIR